MFADAYEKASAYTFPVVISTRTWRGTVNSDLAAFVILNDEGWFATAAHVIASFMTWRQHATEIAAYNESVARLNAWAWAVVENMVAYMFENGVSRDNPYREWSDAYYQNRIAQVGSRR